MSDDKKSSFKLFDKLKKVKHIEIYIAIVFIVVILLIYMSNNKSKKDTINKDNYNSSSLMAYVDQMEDNLQDILSQIGGVSNVNVMITLDIGQASIKDSNIVLDEFPEINGVVVTAKGVEQTAVRLKVLRAIETVIDIKNGRIEILSSE